MHIVRVFITLALGFGAAANASVPLVEVEQAPVAFDFSGRLVPKWTGGALVVVDHLAPAITLHAFGRDGRSLQRVPLDIPGGSWSMVGQFARAMTVRSP